jgi:hypothetical protein
MSLKAQTYPLAANTLDRQVEGMSVRAWRG